MAKKKAKKKLVSKKKPEVQLPQDRWIIWLIYTVLVLLPLAISRISFDQFDIVKLAIFKVLVLVIIFVWLARLMSRPEPLSWSWRELLLAAFLIVAIFSVLTSIHIPTALHGKYKRYEGLFTFITYFSAYFVALQTFRKKEQVSTFFEIVSFVGAAVSFYGILQFFGLDPINWGDVPFEQRRSFSTFGNPDLLAGYLVIAFPAALVSFFNNTNRKWFHGGAAVILSVGLMTALTRSGWLGMLAGGLALLILLGRSLRLYRQQVAVMAVSLALVVATIGVVSASIPGLSMADKFQGAFKLTSGTALGRFEIWKAGFSMMKDRPVFGQGLDTFRLASEHFETKRYVQSVQGGTVSDNAHNYPVHLGAGGGPLAAILLYAFFIAWLVRMIKIRNKLPTDQEKLLVVGAAASVIGYLTTMMLGISIVGASSTFWLMMGAVAGLVRQKDPVQKSLDIAKWSEGARLTGAMILLVLSTVIAGFSVAMYAGDIYFVRGMIAQSRNVQEVEANFERAAALYPGNGRIMSRLGQLYLQWANQAIGQKDAANFKLYMDKAILSFERAVRMEPIEADYKVFLANAYGNKGDLEGALKVLDEVIERRPYSVPGHYLSGQFKERLNRKKEAIDHYELVYGLAPSYMNIPEVLVRVYEEIGNPAKAAKYKNIQ